MKRPVRAFTRVVVLAALTATAISVQSLAFIASVNNWQVPVVYLNRFGEGPFELVLLTTVSVSGMWVLWDELIGKGNGTIH